MLFLSYLLAVAGLFVFSSYRVEDGDDVWRALCKICCTGNRRLVDVHGVRVLKDREAARYINIKLTALLTLHFKPVMI